MMRLVPIALCCAVLIASGCAATQEERLHKAMIEEEDPIVCEESAPIGTRVARRTCMRQSQIDALQRNSQEALDNVQRSSKISSGT